MPPAIAGAAIGAGGSILGGLFGANAAGKAANAQVQAEKYAADIQKQEADAALAFQKDIFNTEQANQAPFLKAGQGAITTLSGLLKSGDFGPFTEKFVAPTAATEQNDPGYQFRLQQGENALQNSAAARGGLLSEGTAKNLEDYSQNYASNEYGSVYNRALQQYQQNYNIFEQNQANKFNRYASLAGIGQTSAGQLNTAGEAAARGVTGIDMGLGTQLGQDYANMGAAQASGYIGGANALGGGISSGLSGIGQILSLQQLLSSLNGGAGSQPTGFEV